MSLSLEPVGSATEEMPVVEQTGEAVAEETTEAMAEETTETVAEKTTEAVTEETTETVAVTEPKPVPKKRGRPKAAAKQVAKAALPKRAVRMKPPSPASSTRSDDNDKTPLNRDDMETLLLDYLVKRKQSQQSARRAMWSQLAGLS